MEEGHEVRPQSQDDMVCREIRIFGRFLQRVQEIFWHLIGCKMSLFVVFRIRRLYMSMVVMLNALH